MKNLKFNLLRVSLFIVMMLGLLFFAEKDTKTTVFAMSQSEYNSKINEFINHANWKNGTSWGYYQTPKIAWNGIGCCAYVNDFARYVYGADSQKAGVQYVGVSNIKTGDVLYVNSSKYGEHWIAVLERNGNNLYVAEGNASNAVRISTSEWTISGETLYNSWSKCTYTLTYGYYYNEIVDFKGNLDSCTGDIGAINVRGWAFDQSDKTKSIEVHVYIGGRVGETGAECHVLTANTERSDVNDVYPGVGNYHGFNARITTSKSGQQNVYFYVLNPETGDNAFIDSVTINITPDTTAPTLSNVYIRDVTDTGYTVYCNVSDNVGISKVAFPTWTETNGQDDLASEWSTTQAVYQPVSGNTYCFKIKTSDHNNETGTYITHVYAYDAAGNYTSDGVSIVIQPVTGVSLNKTSATLTSKGATTTLIANVLPSNATNKGVTWKSSNTSVATVNSSGVVTAVGNGTATITATTASGGKTVTCKVTVSIAPTGVSLNKTSATLTSVGASTTLTATVSPSNAANKNITWKSSNTSVATVNSSGVVTAVGNGTATITATTAVGSKTATCKVTVSIATTGVSLNKTSATLTKKGETLTLTATVSPSNAANRNVTWKSSDTSVATVSSSGVVTAVENGTATITVTTESGSKTATCMVTVDTILDTPVLTNVEGYANGVKIAWDSVKGAEKYRVFRRTSNETWQVIGDTTTSSYIDTKAVAGTTYIYTVRCISSDSKVFTSSYDNIGKSIKYAVTPRITTLSAETDGVKISWAAATGAEKYRVFRKNTSGKWVIIGDTTATNYVDKNVTSGTTYVYTVRCINNAETTYTSYFDTAGKSIEYIGTPSITTVDGQANGVRVVWKAVTGAEKYRVFRRTGSETWTVVGDTTASSYIDITAIAGTKYVYTVRCMSSDAKMFTSSFDVEGKYIKYAETPKLTTLSAETGGVKISWKAAIGAEKYRVFRKNTAGSWEVIGDTTTTSFTDTNVTSGTTYTYTVRCISSDGKVFTSFCDSLGKSVKYISTPVLITVDGQANGVRVVWKEVTGAEKYRVFRRTGSGTWTVIGDTTASSYVDTTATVGTKYVYTVRCVSSDAKVFTSSFDVEGKYIKYAETPKLTTLSAETDGVKVSWKAAIGAEKYRVFRKNTAGSWEVIGDTTTTSFIDTNVTSGTTYIYTVRCINSDGKVFTSFCDSLGKSIKYISTPVMTTVDGQVNGVRVVWKEVTGAEKYRVFRRTGSGTWTVIGDTTASSYIDTTAAVGTKYVYTVRCVSSDGKAFTSSFDVAGRYIKYAETPVLTTIISETEGVKISWKASIGAEKYRVFRKNTSGSWDVIGDTTATNYVDTNVTSGNTYTYTVRCINSDGTAFTSFCDGIGKSIKYEEK